MDYQFGKEYKLCRQKLIDALFASKKSVKKYPFVIHYQLVEEELEKPFQVVISVPKRIFKRAHDRNRIKRITKEVFRHEKHKLEDFLITNRKYLTLFLVYTANEELPQKLLREKFKKMIDTLLNEIQ